jgi:hypothetical protein
VTTRATARIALIDALRELERWDDDALDHAFSYAQRAAFCILDLRGTTDPIRIAAPEVEPPGLTARPHRPPGKPAGTQQAASPIENVQGAK